MKENDNTILIIILVILIVLFFGGFGYGMMGPFGRGMWGMMSGSYGYETGGIFSWIFNIIVLVAVVLLIVWLVKQIQKPNKK